MAASVPFLRVLIVGEKSSAVGTRRSLTVAKGPDFSMNQEEKDEQELVVHKSG